MKFYLNTTLGMILTSHVTSTFVPPPGVSNADTPNMNSDSPWKQLEKQLELHLVKWMKEAQYLIDASNQFMTDYDEKMKDSTRSSTREQMKENLNSFTNAYNKVTTHSAKISYIIQRMKQASTRIFDQSNRAIQSTEQRDIKLRSDYYNHWIQYLTKQRDLLYTKQDQLHSRMDALTTRIIPLDEMVEKSRLDELNDHLGELDEVDNNYDNLFPINF